MIIKRNQNCNCAEKNFMNFNGQNDNKKFKYK